MSGKLTYLLTGAERYRAGRGLFEELRARFQREGFETFGNEVISTYAESFARAVGYLREQLGKIDFLVYVAVPTCRSSTPDSTARDLSGEFNRELLGLVNACMELRPVFSEGARVVLLTVRPESFGSVHRAVTKMVPAVFGLINDTPTFEHLRLVQFELKDYLMSYSSGNLPEILNQIVELVKPAQALQNGVGTA